MAKRSKNQLLQKKLFYKKESAWNSYDNKKVFKFAEDYKNFLFQSKTERSTVKKLIKELKKQGYKDIQSLKKLNKGDKVYKVFKHRSVLTAHIGNNFETLRILASHIDSPRLDLKPNPLYEDASLAMLKSHYYGGIKKYHWVNLPLAMYAVVHTSKGKKEIVYGENEDEPKFIIPDLLPHLARDQLQKKMADGIRGEDLNIVIGNIPIKDEEINEKVKLNILKILNEKYGVVEKDFLSADITFVPAGKPYDVGFDSSLIVGYGQDDHISVFASIKALFGIKNPKNTLIGMFVDKEEIGSYGNTGAQSRILENFILDLLSLHSSRQRITQMFENSYALSCDVTAGLNPNFKDAHDPLNVSLLGNGVAVEKYGGGGGKYSTNDAPSEYMSWYVKLLDKNKVIWQTGELGRIDLGGGGTIAMYLAKYGMDVIDVGVPILAMHSPMELISKADLYSSYLAYKTFLEN